MEKHRPTLGVVWRQQQRYNQRVKEIQKRSQVEWTETYLLGLVSEVGELLQECNWKKNRLQSREDFGPNVPGELADLTKYVLCLWENLGYTPDDMLRECWDKGLILDQKFQQEHRPQISNRAVLMLDLDGAIADFRRGFEEWVNRHPQYRESLPTLREEEILTLHMDVNKNWPFAEYTRAKMEFEQSGGYGKLPPYPNLIRSIHHLQQVHHYYVVVWTARPGNQLKRVWLDTWNWLTENGLQPDEFHFGGDERVRDAVRLRDAGNSVLAIEDNAELAQRYLSNQIPTVLVDQPYNRGFEGAHLTRVFKETQALAFILNNLRYKVYGIKEGERNGQVQ